MKRPILIGVAIVGCALIAVADWRLSIFFTTHLNEQDVDHVSR